VKILPILSYPDTNQCKTFIFSQNKNKSGIYCWYNKITNKSYVGSAVNLTKRLKCYYSLNFLKKNLLRNRSLIYAAFLEHTYSDFSLDIFEYCNRNIILIREQYYMDILKPKYNMLKRANSRLGHKHSEKPKLN